MEILSGKFQTNAMMEYESADAFRAGAPPVKMFHKSAYMMSRKHAEKQLRTSGKLQGEGRWGKWRLEKDEASRSAPLLVDGKEAFRIYLEVKEETHT